MFNDLTGDYDKVTETNKNKVNEFLKYEELMDRSPQTVAQYGGWLRTFFTWNYRNNNDKDFISCTKGDYFRYLTYISSLNESPACIHAFRAALSSMSDWFCNAYGDEYPAFRNIVVNLPIPTMKNIKKKTIISDEELKKILDTLVDQKQYELACFVSLLSSCGCRKAEAIQMKVDFFTSENLFCNSILYKTPLIRTKGAGKRGKLLNKYIIKETFDPYLNMWLGERKRKGITSEYLFVKRQNMSASLSTAESFAMRISKICNIKFYAHCLRHYFATKLVKIGIPSSTIVKIFGWSSAEMLETYNDETTDEAIVRDLGKLFSDAKLRWFNNYGT